jgi:hypothetical protein
MQLSQKISFALPFALIFAMSVLTVSSSHSMELPGDEKPQITSSGIQDEDPKEGEETMQQLPKQSNRETVAALRQKIFLAIDRYDVTSLKTALEALPGEITLNDEALRYNGILPLDRARANLLRNVNTSNSTVKKALEIIKILLNAGACFQGEAANIMSQLEVIATERGISDFLSLFLPTNVN